MVEKIVAIAFIYACCCIAWLVLGGTVEVCTHAQDHDLAAAVVTGAPGYHVRPV